MISKSKYLEFDKVLKIALGELNIKNFDKNL